MYTYFLLEHKLSARGLKKTDLVSLLGISSRTIAKIAKGEKIANRVLQRIAEFLNCEPEELFSISVDDPVLQTLREEKAIKLPGGLYHELQVRMTYNSNHIEGSKLTEEQTRLIFETRTLDIKGGVLVDDIIETVNHFRCIDYVIDVALEPLSEDIIKRLHLLLKQGTKDSELSWFAVGDYKKKANIVGDRLTTAPEDVPSAMKKLISDYSEIPHPSFEDIVAFHAEFEYIHPFQDGNGRVGRLVALKECLKAGIIPFIIEDRKKSFYYRGLSNWRQEKGWLIDTCLDGQDTFKSLLHALGIEEGNK